MTDSYLQNVFTASIAIFQPYLATPTKATISEIYVDSSKRREDSMEQGCDHRERRQPGNAGDVEPQSGRRRYTYGAANALGRSKPI